MAEQSREMRLLLEELEAAESELRDAMRCLAEAEERAEEARWARESAEAAVEEQSCREARARR